MTQSIAHPAWRCGCGFAADHESYLEHRRGWKRRPECARARARLSSSLLRPPGPVPKDEGYSTTRRGRVRVRNPLLWDQLLFYGCIAPEFLIARFPDEQIEEGIRRLRAAKKSGALIRNWGGLLQWLLEQGGLELPPPPEPEPEPAAERPLTAEEQRQIDERRRRIHERFVAARQEDVQRRKKMEEYVNSLWQPATPEGENIVAFTRGGDGQ